MTIRYLFCITPGRSGSDYLAGLLAHARNAVSVHEGVPVMNGRPMGRLNDGDDRELRALMPAKLGAIRRQVRLGHAYCETNHSFIKGCSPRSCWSRGPTWTGRSAGRSTRGTSGRGRRS